jgi:hypothetical protein
MFYMQSKLIESIAQDRHRGARADRPNVPLGFQGRLRCHHLVVPLTITDTVTSCRLSPCRTLV